MRKIIAMLSACGLFFLTGCQESSSIGIIGGADGPTSIIVASSPGAGYIAAAISVIVMAVIIAVMAGKKKGK